MIYSPLLISLPTADRVRAHAFYRDALGLEAVGEPADDGVVEPLLFVLNADTRLMLVPTGGFGWVIGDREVAEPTTSECVIGLVATSEAGVNEIVERARQAGSARRDRTRTAAVGIRGDVHRPRRPRLERDVGATARMTGTGRWILISSTYRYGM